MSTLMLPPGKRIFENKTFSKEFLELTLEEIRSAGEFTGVLKSAGEHVQDLLFFLKGKPYAAGRIEGDRPSSFNIRDFFEALPSGVKDHALLSLHEIDPVFFKGMLVYLQREPTIKASTKLLNLDDILGQIQDQSAGALVILKRDGGMNFFFFFKGKAVKSHYAGPADANSAAVPLTEQLVLFAYPNDMAPVDAFVYLDIATSAAADAEDIRDTELAEMPYKMEEGQRASLSPRVFLTVVEGPDMEKAFDSPLPCTIGRRECDVLLGDRMVSGRHAVLRESGGRLVIEDLESTNGTYVNGVEIKARELAAGEIITVGETRLRLEKVVFS
jgi:hypothetical protein